jgi:hypothetical protein
MPKLTTPAPTCIGGGLVLTAQADFPGQAIYWKLVGVNLDTGAEIAPLGSLRWAFRQADHTGYATNIYMAPKTPWVGNKTDRIKAIVGKDS